MRKIYGIEILNKICSYRSQMYESRIHTQREHEQSFRGKYHEDFYPYAGFEYKEYLTQSYEEGLPRISCLCEKCISYVSSGCLCTHFNRTCGVHSKIFTKNLYGLEFMQNNLKNKKNCIKKGEMAYTKHKLKYFNKTSAQKSLTHKFIYKNNIHPLSNFGHQPWAVQDNNATLSFFIAKLVILNYFDFNNSVCEYTLEKFQNILPKYLISGYIYLKKYFRVIKRRLSDCNLLAKIFLTCCYISAKMMNDSYVSSSEFIETFSYDPCEIGYIEAHILSEINYELDISSKSWRHWSENDN